MLAFPGSEITNHSLSPLTVTDAVGSYQRVNQMNNQVTLALWQHHKAMRLEFLSRTNLTPLSVVCAVVVKQLS